MNQAPPSPRLATTKILLRTGVLFAAFAAPAAALDVFTTEFARRAGDFVELNPAGFVPLDVAVVREVGVLVMSTGLVLVGAYFRRDALSCAGQLAFEPFVEKLFSRLVWAVALMWVAFLGVGLRYLTVISNVCYMTIGWSPIDSVSLLPLQSLLGDDTMGYVAYTLLAVVLLWYPMAALTLRSLYAVHRRA